MKPLSLKTLIKKSTNSRNAQAYEKLANIDSERDWGNDTTVTPIPKYTKPPIVAWSAVAKSAFKAGVFVFRP